MALLSEILPQLERMFPSQWAAEWDNPGFQTGRKNLQIRKILLSLDITEATVDEALRLSASLIISHHPLFFKPLKKIDDQSFPASILHKLIQHDIAAVSLHTNLDFRYYDCMGKTIGLRKIRPLGKIPGKIPLAAGCTGILPQKLELRAFCELLHKKFSLPFLHVIGEAKQGIRTVSAFAGSGSGFLTLSKDSDVTVTSEIGYHEALKITEEKRTVIDIGHFPSERPYLGELRKDLSRNLSKLGISIHISETTKNPIKGVQYE